MKLWLKNNAWPNEGLDQTSWPMAIISSQLRRRISDATVRANFTCLLERMALVGEGDTRGLGRGGVGRERMRKR